MNMKKVIAVVSAAVMLVSSVTVNAKTIIQGKVVQSPFTELNANLAAGTYDIADTDATYQIIAYVTETHLCGELRAEKAPLEEYLIESEGEHFVRENGDVYRKGKVYRSCIDKKTGKIVSKTCIRENHAKVMYDTSGLEIVKE